MAINVDQPQIQPAHTDTRIPGISHFSMFPEPSDRSHRFGVVRPIRKRVIALASGLQKHGKDHWAFTAGGPIGLHALDEGYDETANKFIKDGKIIKPVEYDVPEPNGKKRDSSIQAAATEIWDDFVANYLWSLDNFRTVVVDTSTELWGLLRLARFGAVSTGETTQFGQLNSDMRKLVREAYNHDANVIFLQRLGKKYINKEWNGEYETKGWSEMAFEVQLVLRLWREDPDVFHSYIEDCRLEPKMNGRDYTAAGDIPLNSFPYIAADIYGDSVSDWE